MASTSTPRRVKVTATRSFERGGTWTFKTMNMLSGVVPGYSYRRSQVLGKHAPAVLLALAAHHDMDANSLTALPGYTAGGLAPFVGLGVGTVSAVLLDLYRRNWVERYTSSSGLRYRLIASALRTPVEG